MNVRRPISDPARQPKALEAKPKNERKTPEHCEFCRKMRAMARRAFAWRRR